MKRTAVIMAAALSLSVAVGWADEAIGVDDAVRAALANNPGLARSRIELEAARRSADVAWNGLLPGLSIGVGAGGAGAGGAAMYGSAAAGITVSTSFLGDIETARLEYENALATFETASRDVELEVRKAYYAIVLAMENVTLIERSMATAQKSYDQAEAKRKAGLAPELDSLSTLVVLESLKPKLASAKVTYDNKLADFKRLIGFDQKRGISLVDTLDAAATLAGFDATTVTIGTAPAVAALERSLTLAVARKKAADAAVYSPDLSLSMSYKPAYSGVAWESQGSISASLSFSVDAILPWSKERLAAAEAADMIATIESSLAEARTNATIAVESLVRQIEQSLSSLTALRLNVTLAERTLSLMEEAYKFGTKDIMSLQSARDSLDQARMQVLEEAYTLVSATLDLEYALDVPFGTLGR